MLSAIYLFNAWIVQSASKKYSQSLFGQLTAYSLNWGGFKSTLGAGFKVLAHSPASVTVWLIILFGFCAFAGKKGRIAGAMHGLTHLFVNLMLAWIFALLNFALLFPFFSKEDAEASQIAETIFDSVPQTLLFTGEMLCSACSWPAAFFAHLIIYSPAPLPPHRRSFFGPGDS
jgi:hypothetical protein